MAASKTFTCHVSSYGLQEVFKGHNSHKTECRKCGEELHHPLGVSFEICEKCGNRSYQVRWRHITDMVQKGQVSFRVRAKSIPDLRENVRNKLVEQNVLYEDWTETSVISKK